MVATADTDSVHDIELQHADTNGSQPSTTRLSTSSTLSEALSRADTTRSSITAFAKGLARHVPDMRMFAPSEQAVKIKKESQMQNSRNVEDHKLNSSLPLALESKVLKGTTQESPVALEEPSNRLSTGNTELQSSTKGSLRDRRKVKLDLSLPPEISELPTRIRATPAALSSFIITPSRPRSPQTPWIRSEPAWELHKFPKSAPIMEENPLQRDGDKLDSAGLLPGTDKISSSQSPNHKRPHFKVRNRFYINRPRLKRSRSGRSGTSDSTTARTPDDAQSTIDSQALQEHLAQTTIELQQLSRNAISTRSRRWRFKASSDEALRTPESNSHFSINPFKRSNRVSDQIDEKDNKSHLMNPSRPWFRKHSANSHASPSSPLDHVLIPPVFIPPGVHRVLTPPHFDDHGEVKGKLADFFFDIHGSGGQIRKPKTSPGGFWDSDALLMSLTPGIDPNEEDEEEGPEGRAAHVQTPMPANFGVAGIPRMGLPTPMFEQDSWTRIQFGGETADEHAHKMLTLQEDEERRKFEWLIPEHLPNSPICPLHSAYRGPYKGVCYWHGSRKSGILSGAKEKYIRKLDDNNAGTHEESWGSGEESSTKQYRTRRGSRGWAVGKFDIPMQEIKKRRLASLSSP